MALDKKFYGNFARTHKIGDDKENLFDLAGGIKTIDPSFEEDTESIGYYDLNGGQETYVTGQTYQFDIEGDRLYSDEAQEYIREKLTKSDARDCFFEVTEPDGRVLSGQAKITNIVPFGGDANGRSQFNFSVVFNGTPTDTKK